MPLVVDSRWAKAFANIAVPLSVFSGSGSELRVFVSYGI